MKSRREERRTTFIRPITKAVINATRGEILTAGARVALIRFAMRVDTATERGKGRLKVRLMRVERTD